MRGTDVDYDSDLLLIESGITVSDTGGTTAIADWGLEITGGSGTVAMTTGDTATFSVRPPNSKSMDVVIGATTDSYPEFGAIIMAQARGNGELFEVDCYRLKAAGLPIGFATNEWSNAEVTCTAFYDSTRNGVFSMRHVTPV